VKKLLCAAAILFFGLSFNLALAMTEVPYTGVEYMPVGETMYMKIEGPKLNEGDLILITDKRGSDATKIGRIVKMISNGRYAVEIQANDKK
jgi:DNA helicase TIP49 (TBP-interacting protein)